MRKLIRYIAFGFLSFALLQVKGQDIQFSQFYATNMYLNPAFAGSDHHNRILFHQRLQWPKIDAKYNTSMFAYDRYFQKYQSGFGIMMVQDFQGSGDLMTTDVSVQYAYEMHIDAGHSLRFGLQTGVLVRDVGFDLVFPHNLTTKGIATPPDVRPVSKPLFDVSSGALYFTKDFYFSLSAHHINQPSTSYLFQPLTGGLPANAPSNMRLPIRFAGVAGYRINLAKNGGYGNTMAYLKAYTTPKKRSITPTVHYKLQGKSDQVDIGIYGIYDVLLAGLWYRGIPLKRYQHDFGLPTQTGIPGLHNNESVVFVLGTVFKGAEIAYSYDFVFSKLRPTGTFGAHEINITFVPHHFEKKPKFMKELPCPIPTLR